MLPMARAICGLCCVVGPGALAPLTLWPRPRRVLVGSGPAGGWILEGEKNAKHAICTHMRSQVGACARGAWCGADNGENGDHSAAGLDIRIQKALAMAALVVAISRVALGPHG